MSASPSTRVVLLVGVEGDSPQGAVLSAEATPLGRLLAQPDRTVELVMVSWEGQGSLDGVAVHAVLDPSAPPAADRVLRALGVYALRNWLEGHPIGRLFNSIGPIDPSRVFWRAVKKHPEALSLLRSSQVAIATDLETTKTAWIAVHRGWVDDAHYDHRALALVRGTRSATAS